MSAPVVVIGAGLAGLAAAIAAREAGSEVLVLEKGAESDAGGNAAFSGGLFLFAYETAGDVRSVVGDPGVERIEAEAYSAGAYVTELMDMSGGRLDVPLACALAERSLEVTRWLASCGVRFEIGPLGYVRDGTLHLPPGAVTQVAGEGWGRGRGLIEPLLRRARELGVAFRYSAPVVDLVRRDGRVSGVVVEGGEEVAAGAVVVASGGYQASRELRRERLGAAWADVKLRGTRLSDGGGILAGLRAGAASAGDWSRCHSAAVDPGTPSPVRNDEPSPPPLHGFWLGIMVNRLGHRFVDEGPGPWIKHYSKMGKAIMGQPGGEAFQLFDQRAASRVAEVFAPTATPIAAPTVEALADRLELPREALAETVAGFGRAAGGGEVDFDVVDGRGTAGVEPPKSNWASPLDAPPYVAYRAVTGLTFTFAGLRIDPDGRALDERGRPVPGLFAGGEATGGLFFGDYPGGAALMRSAVFGRAAGESAAAAAGTA